MHCPSVNYIFHTLMDRWALSTRELPTLEECQHFQPGIYAAKVFRQDETDELVINLSSAPL